MNGNSTNLPHWLKKRVLAHLTEAHTGVKPAVLRRGAQRIGNLILSNWLTCWDPVHHGGLKTVMAIEELVRERLGPLVDLSCGQLFHGHVIPVQRVLVMIDEAYSASLGKCVCRAAGVTQDLGQGDSTYSIASPEVAAEHLAVILETHERISEDPDAGAQTSPRILAALDKVHQADSLPPTHRLALLWRETYPFWEILLSHPSLNADWARNMERHHKSIPVHKDLMKALVMAQYHTRGAIFTSMEVVDEPYAICTCPGPENDRGCSLVNWYYFSRLDHVLFPNENDFFGQAKDSEGRVLPCRRFPARASRPCLGCGCEHEKPYR